MAEPIDRLATALADRYRIEREIGAGGMAAVYLASDLKHDRRVAIKVLREDLAATIGAERFHREIRIAAKLQHPHILPLLDSGDAAGFLFYVMPYVEGESLRERLAREGALPIADAVRILRDVADALTEAHAHGVVHRDIKPDNVMLTAHHALVTDFGIAKAMSAAATAGTLTTAGVTVGTPAYMAPEQAAGDPHVDARADIYAVGVLGYEMLTGSAPFGGATAQQVLAAQVTKVPEAVSGLRPATPGALADLIMRCLEKRPADRWETADQLLSRIEAAARSGASARSAADLWTRWRRRLAAAGLLLAAMAVWLVVSRRHGAPAAQRVVVAPYRNATGDTSLDPVGILAADWITQGLVQANIPGIVSQATVLGPAAAPQRADIVGLARATRAGTVVAGTYYRQADSLLFQTQIIDAASGRVVAALEPVAGTSRAPLEAVGAVRQRVMAALAGRVNPALAAWGAVIARPPTYEAYLAHAAGVEAYAHGRYRDARDQFRRALALDSTFTLALLWQGLSEWDLGSTDAYARVDTITSRLERRRSRLSRYEQDRLDRLEALEAFDWAKAYQAGRRAADASGGADEDTREVALDGMRLNHPREAMRILEKLDPTRGWIREWSSEYWFFLGTAYHMLGDYAAELRVYQRATAGGENGTLVTIVGLRALAGLKRDRDLASLLEDAADRTQSPADVAWLYREAGGGLIAGGSRDPGLAVLRRGVTRLRAFGAPPPDSAELDWRYELARLRYESGDWMGCGAAWAASRRVRALADARGFVELSCPPALLAAREGRRAEAERELAETGRSLRSSDRQERANWWLTGARVAAIFGDTAHAVDALRQAMPVMGFSGETLEWWLDPDLRPLGSYQPFQELMRPKG